MKKMSCVLLWGFLVLLQGAVVSTPAAVIRELEDRDGLLAFTLETPEHPGSGSDHTRKIFHPGRRTLLGGTI